MNQIPARDAKPKKLATCLLIRPTPGGSLIKDNWMRLSRLAVGAEVEQEEGHP
jgi:hypothetical protein